MAKLPKEVDFTPINLDDAPTEVAKIPDDPWLSIVESMHTRGFGNLFCRHETKIRFTDDKKISFLREYAKSGRKGFAAQIVGLSGAAVNLEAKKDPVFAAAVEEAQLYFQDLLIGEMYRRGVEGFKREVVGGKFKNEIIEILDYSDKALDMVARVHIPAMQRKQIEVKTESKSETTITHVNQTGLDLANMDPADLLLFKQIMENQAKKLEDAEADASAIEGDFQNA